MTESQECFKRELLTVFHRWQEEGDMTPEDAMEAVQEALNDWLEEPVIVFEPDPDIIEALDEERDSKEEP